MLISDWFTSVIQVKLEDDINILRLTPFLPAPRKAANDNDYPYET